MKFAPKKSTPNLSMGIVGLPNIGKSHLFNVLTESEIRTENFAFCTIDPNRANAAKPDEKYDNLVKFAKPVKGVPNYLKVIDIAGLIKNAHSGAGLGNSFLDNILNVDGIFQVVRCFKEKDVVHVENDINPANDIETINNELRMKDLQLVRGLIEKFEKDNRAKKLEKKAQAHINCLKKMASVLNFSWLNFQWKKSTGIEKSCEFDVFKNVVENGGWTNEEISIINKERLLTVKEVVYLANLSDADYESKKGKLFSKAVKYLAASSDIPEYKEIEGLEKLKRKSTIIPFCFSKIPPNLIQAGYDALDLITFYTVGKVEVRAWTCQKNTTAPDAAGLIHSDFRDYFISVDVYNYDDINIQVEGDNATGLKEADLKAKGLIKNKGKDYIIKDGDIVKFKSNPPKGGKNKK